MSSYNYYSNSVSAECYKNDGEQTFSSEKAERGLEILYIYLQDFTNDKKWMIIRNRKNWNIYITDITD